MLHALWTKKSLRYWIAVGMAVALAPLTLSAAGGFLLLNHGVIAPFQDVALRQRDQIVPTQHLRLLVWDALVPVDEFIEGGAPEQKPAYRMLRERIETSFASLHETLKTEPEARILLERARGNWTAADNIATALLSVGRPPGEANGRALIEQFHGEIAAASDKLGAVYNDLVIDLHADHDMAIRYYERSLWLAGIACMISLLAMLGGVVVIGRVMSASVDRLVDGAARFAEGDREHLIEVRIPPELKKVADEFNRMIRRIHDSETALAELARRDGLTRLLNRRAFDEALEEMYARMRRTPEEGALMTMDLDHFKRINDTYGHAAGDEVLRAFAGLVTSELRAFDHAFRTGGEEFAVLLPNIDMDVARDMAERLREAVAAHPIRAGEVDISATVSIGIAKATIAIRQNELMEAADAALYQAKTTGRNRVVAIDEYGARGAAPQPEESFRVKSG